MHYFAVVVALLSALVVTPFVKKLAFKLNAVDKPSSRKVHAKIMPRMGGLAIYIAFVVGVLVNQSYSSEVWGLLIGSTIIVALGIVDDIKEISPKVKLIGQTLAAIVAIMFGIKVSFLTNPFSGIIQLGWFTYPVTIIWIIGITNAVNLIDGLDGLAAGVSGIAALTLGVVAWTEGQVQIAALAFILAASVLGFLKYNFNPAQIFMGDTGSMFLGFNLASMAIMGLTKSATIISLFVPVIILGIPILDTAFAIIRRYLKGQPIFSADKDHLHHRLLALGLTHRQTVLAIYAVNLLLGGSAILVAVLTTAQGMMIIAFMSISIVYFADRLGILRIRSAVATKNSSKAIAK